MYIYIARTFVQIEGPSLKLGGGTERERVRDRFSNGVKLPSLLTWMIIGRENFIESTYFFFLFLFLFLIPFSLLTRGCHPRPSVQFVEADRKKKSPSRLYGCTFSSSRPSPDFFPRVSLSLRFRRYRGIYREIPNYAFPDITCWYYGYNDSIRKEWLVSFDRPVIAI